MWVLMVIYFGTQISFIDYSSLETCQRAAQIVNAQSQAMNNFRGVCLPRD